MTPDQMIQLVVGIAIAFLVWNLRSTLVDLKEEIKGLKEAYQDILKNYVQDKDLKPYRQDISELFAKYNALKVECAKHHAGQ